MKCTLYIAGALALVLGTGLTACGGPPGLSKSAKRGREIFLGASNPKCGTCHALRDAGSIGATGPNLDELKPDAARVLRSVQQGVGVMPTQKGVLSQGQMEDVANYVAEAAGR